MWAGTLEVPDHIERAPSETCAEGGEYQTVALLDAVAALVETQGYRSGRRVALFLNVHKHLVVVDAQTCAHGLDDAEVGLMRAEPGDVLDGEIVFLHHFE